MASNYTDFFDEDDGSEPQPDARPAERGKGKGAKAAQAEPAARHAHGPKGDAPSTGRDASGRRRPPSFGRVVVIAVVALALGFALGYFFALAQVSASIDSLYGQLQSGSSSTSSSSSTSAPSTSSSSEGSVSVNESAGLPSGHPDLSSMINDDGSVNEEALAAYKAQMAAASSAQGASGSGTSD
jgi:hypothetical protein